ncbi:MAG: tRNA pseudouridine(55) synthase TruB [Candidatus Sulfobium sp.]
MPDGANIIINLNKPRDITSQGAVSRVKRLLGVRKAGHAGTLDPLATGILLVCLNEATKVTRFLMDMDKEYVARVKLGERTDTCDSRGTVIEKRHVPPLEKAAIESVASMFLGTISQKPPMYSAVKIGGKTLHKLARKGIEIERPERRVEIHDIRVLEVELPYFDLSVSCSKGTYIRTLCDDMGTRLGTGAHLTALERTRVGFFSVDDAVSLEGLGGEGSVFSRRSFCSIDQVLSGLPEIIFSDQEYRLIKNGVRIRSPKVNELADGSHVRLKAPRGKLFGIGRINSGVIRVERLLHLPPNSEQECDLDHKTLN